MTKRDRAEILKAAEMMASGQAWSISYCGIHIYDQACEFFGKDWMYEINESPDDYEWQEVRVLMLLTLAEIG